jgi:hypothetical protein
MPLVPCWPGPRHGKARRPIKPIGPNCAPTTGGADPSSAAMWLPAACGRRGRRGSGGAQPGRGGGSGVQRTAWPWRSRWRPVWPSHGGGREEAGSAPGSGGRRGSRRSLAMAEEEAAGSAPSRGRGGAWPGRGGGGQRGVPALQWWRRPPSVHGEGGRGNEELGLGLRKCGNLYMKG